METYAPLLTHDAKTASYILSTAVDVTTPEGIFFDDIGLTLDTEMLLSKSGATNQTTVVDGTMSSVTSEGVTTAISVIVMASALMGVLIVLK